MAPGIVLMHYFNRSLTRRVEQINFRLVVATNIKKNFICTKRRETFIAILVTVVFIISNICVFFWSDRQTNRQAYRQTDECM